MKTKSSGALFFHVHEKNSGGAAVSYIRRFRSRENIRIAAKHRDDP